MYSIRDKRIMLDRDLAAFYRTETRALKQAVRRNLERFPEDFMFELEEVDIEYLVSQSVIPSKSYFGGAKPFAFTEQGVSMLSAVLRSPTAIEISVKIIRTFVNMKNFLSENAQIFKRLDSLENYQKTSDEKFEMIFNAIKNKGLKQKQGIFFNGEIFDAYVFISDIIKKSKSSIILIDNYIDESVLTILSKNTENIKIEIYTKNISDKLRLDVKKYNEQYKNLKLKKFNDSHDRFMIIDKKEVYHFGASLKDLGKKWFAFSKFDTEIISIMGKLK
ncbi:ORF6N domain-containing protein [Haliovirga abyssi]|nr:ORF6N domain-containing protein [Haliovirga abyssi]